MTGRRQAIKEECHILTIIELEFVIPRGRDRRSVYVCAIGRFEVDDKGFYDTLPLSKLVLLHDVTVLQRCMLL